ncbi:MAG: cytochrome c oxidase subunit 3 [Bacteroidota bacterium]
MATEIKIVEEAKKPLAMHPKKFALWLFMVSAFMVFAAWTSAYIVRQAEGNWLIFELPTMFKINTVVIIISSMTMQWAYFSARKDKFETTKLATSLTLVLGAAFLIGQVLAYNELIGNRIHFTSRDSSAVSGSFLYVISGFHAVHVVSGVVFLVFVLVSVFKLKAHSKNMLQMEMCTTYWHFLGGLWLYLFVFLLLNR